MKTLIKLASQINGKVNPLKYGKNKDKGFCITDKNNNEILTVSPCYSGYKWCVINRNKFESSTVTYINRLTELKNFKLNAGFNGCKFEF